MRVRQIGATDAAWRHGAHYRYLGRDDAPRCPSRSKAKVSCFLHALPTATCGYVGDPKGDGIPPEQNTAALNDDAKVRQFTHIGNPFMRVAVSIALHNLSAKIFTDAGYS